MANSTDVFKVLSEQDEIKLLEMLRKDIANSIHVLCFAMNVIELKKKVGGIKAGLCSPNGDYSESTVVVYFDLEHMFTATYYSETAAGCARLKNALATTDMFKNSPYVLFSGVHDRVYQSVGTDWCQMKLDHVTTCHIFSLSSETALQFNYKCPEDVGTRRLVAEDAELLDSLWPFSIDGTVEIFRKIIMSSPSCGLYRKSDDKLVSWILRWFHGGLGILQTVEEAKRKGYAQIVVAEICKEFALENWPIHATVLVDNFESNPLFQRMGFSKGFLCHYVAFVPT